MKKKILILDDAPIMRELLKSFLESEYEVFDSTNGQDALERINTGFIPDLIISDVKMPHMDGYEFVKQVKSKSEFSNIPIIILSGISESQQRLRCYENGANDFLLKPFNPKELNLKIKIHLNYSQN